MAAFILQGKVYLTQDDFKSFIALPAPEEFTHDLNITSLALMFNYLVVLDVNGKVYALHRTDTNFRVFKRKYGMM